MNLIRRRLALTGVALAGVALAGAALAGAALAGAASLELVPTRGADKASRRRIAFYNLHTDERLDVEYFRDGAYLPEPLLQVQALLRDFRTGDAHPIDPKLLDYLVDVAERLGAPSEYGVISGYRSPQTNAQLHARSSGVAQHSLHMQGRAIDVRMAGVDCTVLAARARDLMRGGVGYYRASDFVHMDTGDYRTWSG
jgi:uncharacterized protein YcbK (DUF882 family)